MRTRAELSFRMYVGDGMSSALDLYEIGFQAYQTGYEAFLGSLVSNDAFAVVVLVFL